MVSVSGREACTSMERPAKRQRTEAEIQLQARLDDLDSQNRQAELELQIQQKFVYQKSLKLQLKEQQQAMANLNAEQQTWRMPGIWSNAQQPGQLTAALTAGTCLPHGVHQITAAGALPPMQLALSSPEARVKSIRASKRQTKPAAALCNPALFTSKTIAGRYREWADNGVHGGSIKSWLRLTNRGLALPKIGHTSRASDNLRKNKNLPEAIDRLIERGLSREAAIALVEKVVSDFGGLIGIAQQSNAFMRWHTSLLSKLTSDLGRTGKTVMEFKLAYEHEVGMTVSRYVVYTK